jgi:hypothetical protein
MLEDKMEEVREVVLEILVLQEVFVERKDVFRASQALHGRSYEAMLKLIISSPLSLIFVTCEKF